MKALFIVLGLALSLVGFAASAQVDVEVTMDQQQFLPGEAVPVYVHVTNRSGQTLHLGADADWLTFFVETDDGSVVLKKSDPMVISPFDLGSLKVGTMRVDLAPAFALDHLGRFKVTATVHIKDWNQDIRSSTQSFELINGAELWSQTVGVPDPLSSNTPPRVRKYTLLQANYLHDQLRLYVQVTDPSGAEVKVSAIGPMISFGQPEAQLDVSNNLHVLYQSGASTFTYTVVDPNCKITEKETYDYVNTRPRLHQDDNGLITVYGGIRRVETPVLKSPAELAP